jgi:hypothetical protein
MTNSTLIRPALKSRVQALELVFYGRKIDGGDQCPYSQPVKQNILFYRLQIRALVADMRPGPKNLTYLWGIGSNGFGAGEAAGDSTGGGEGVTGGRPVRWAGLFSFNALPPSDWLLVRGTLFGFAGQGQKPPQGRQAAQGQVRSSSLSG